MEMTSIDDRELLKEIDRRFREKAASIREMEFMTKKLLELNEKSREAEEAKTYFLSLVKNEFNNPMSVLLSLVQKIGAQPDQAKVAAVAAMMHKELMYLDFSLKNIFAASEIEYGEKTNHYVRIRPAEVVGEALAYFGPMIGEKSLRVDVSAPVETMVVDAQKFYLILLNLLSNGCEFSYPGGSVSVSLSEGERGYEMKVANLGEGIYEDHSKHIYNRFYTYSTGKTRPSQGLGLGLSVVRELCESMEGEIDHCEEGEKTVFIARFPRKNEEELSVSLGLGSDEFFDTGFPGTVREF